MCKRNQDNGQQGNVSPNGLFGRAPVGKLMKYLMITLLLIFGLNQIVGLIFLVHGSFEIFPAAEQEDKIRTVGLMMLLLPIFFEIFLVRQMLKRDGVR